MTTEERGPARTSAVEHGMTVRRSAQCAALLPMPLAAACAFPAVPDLASRPPAAVFEVLGDLPAMASCLAAAYSADPFRLVVTSAGSAIVITAYGAPTAHNPRRPRPRFAIGVEDAGPGRTRAGLRAAWTLLGPAAEIKRLRTRAASCGHPHAAARRADWPG